MASFESWLELNWINLFQTVGIVLGLVFTSFSWRRDARTRKLSNLLALKKEHRELWNIIHANPEFARILQPEVDLVAAPMTNNEEVFLRQMIVHFAVAFELILEGTPVDAEAFKRDAEEIFSLPLPNLAWRRAINFQSPKFSAFVEQAIASKVGRMSPGT